MKASNEIEQKISTYTFVRNIIFNVFIVTMLINIGIDLLFNYYLPSEYPVLFLYILNGFLAVGVLIQIYLYYLFNKIGKGQEFLKERGFIFGAVLIVTVVAFLFIEL